MFQDPNFKKYLEYIGLGAEIAVALCAPIFFGYWLDLRWDTSPWMLLAGIFMGILILITIFSRLIKNISKPNNRK